VSEKTRQEDWQKLIDEILEQGMDLVWNEETEKYEKKEVRQFPRHHRILTRKKVKLNANNACIV
jgi:hypothetical protein